MIDPVTIQKITDAAQILDVVSDFVSLRKRGASYVGLCPFHADRNPSFYVTPGKNFCKCFSCGEGGNPINFLMKLEQMSYTEALKYLARKYGIPIEERELTDEEKREADKRQSLFILNEFAAKYFHKYLLESDEGKRIGLSYFQERGIRPDTIERFGLGYAPDEWNLFSETAIHKGFSTELLITTGLSSQTQAGKLLTDRFRGRIIFPIYTVSGKPVGFGGRILKKSDKLAKYVNSPQSIIYDKSYQLYGLHQAKRAISKLDKCYLVEGYLDVLQMTQSGVENVVSSSGTALTIPQIRLIQRFTSNVTVLYDGDAPGIKAALRGIDLLLAEGMNIKVVLLPEGEDPDSYAKSHTAEEFQTYLQRNEQDFISFKTNLLLHDSGSDPMQRAKVISDIVHSISIIPDAINRSVYVQATSQKLEISEELLLIEVQKHRNSKYTAHNTPRENTTNEKETLLQTREETKQKEPPKKEELELIRLVVKHGGEDILFLDRDGKPANRIVLASFVYEELASDGILDFTTPLVRQILEEAAMKTRENRDFNSQSYFIHHPQEEINCLAMDLISDRYRLSDLLKSDEDMEKEQEAEALKEQKRLADQCVRAIQIFQNAFVIKRIHEVQREIVIAQRNNESEQILDLLSELKDLNNTKASFAQALGERVIL
ncbi:DNA primase [Porphyromonas crevioricanis]|uniref:DNA primase n=2 Tax=Porphyromonas crevioricanis TaxID=393921 RepID=A0A0A2FLL8_9PORP|nr:DNA primase [Porphyromonas crevioricanis]KGN91042.1 DNA primase [Porphyromonas crevioricanis]KGN94642.1 DNA primase [Porphyromonas crevioricanis]SJZ56941.1 DNA primase [Porphyromonas crevioricanis]SQH73393.1 DNA primase [Porphyromonas crevioricanis]GAD05360.1 DNA primase [Porphyromonas crevioricanis JCM 15906]